MKFVLPFLLLFVGIGAAAALQLLAGDLNRAAHRRRRKPGTAFEPDVDPAEEDDQVRFEDGLRTLAASPSLPDHIRRKLRLYRGLQVVSVAACVAAALLTPR